MYLNTPPLATTIAQSGCQSEIRSASETRYTNTSFASSTLLGIQSCDRVLHPLHIVALRQVREHDLLEIRGALCHCACTVKSGQSGPRALPSR